MRYFTSSLFLLALNCPTKLFYKGKPQYPEKNNQDEFKKELSEGVFQITALARSYYHNGHEIKGKDINKQIETTHELLKQDNVTIYDAVIIYENLLIQIDILKKEGTQVNFITVSTNLFSGNKQTDFLGGSGRISSKWRPTLFDLAFQKYVLQKARPQFELKSYLIVVDPNAKASVSGLNQKFKLSIDKDGSSRIMTTETGSKDALASPILKSINVDEIVDGIYEEKTKEELQLSFEDSIWKYAEAYAKDRKIDTPIGKHCAYCEFRTNSAQPISGFKECWQAQTNLSYKELDQPLTFDVWRWERLRNDRMKEKGVHLIKDMTKHYIGNVKPDGSGRLTDKERQWQQVRKQIENDSTPYLSKEGILRKIKTLQYPLHFLYFHSTPLAIPFNENGHPFEEIAFQYSHHILKRDGSIENARQYVNLDKGVFPNYDYIRTLKSELNKDEGTIFRFGPHGNVLLNKIKHQLQDDPNPPNDATELIEFIKDITRRALITGRRSMVDMKYLLKDYYYDPYMGGSNSLNSLINAIFKRTSALESKFNSLNKDLRESENQEVKLAYAKIQFTMTTELEMKNLKETIIKSGKSNSLKMVLAFQYWLNECKKG